MEQVVFDLEKEENGLADVLGVPHERILELQKLSEVSIWELKHPSRYEKGVSNVEFLEAMMKHANTTGEQVIQAFTAGQIWATEFSEFYEYDE